MVAQSIDQNDIKSILSSRESVNDGNTLHTCKRKGHMHVNHQGACECLPVV